MIKLLDALPIQSYDLLVKRIKGAAPPGGASSLSLCVR